MSRYAFILGHVPVLSSIEAKMLVPDLLIQSIQNGVLIGESQACDPIATMESSGGLVKIARHYMTTGVDDCAGIIATALQELVPAGKITFAISQYGLRGEFQGNKVAMQVKSILKEAGRAVRHVYSKDRALSSASLLFNEFGKPGHVEVCLIPTQPQHTPPLKLRHPSREGNLKILSNGGVAERRVSGGHPGSDPKGGVGKDSQGQIGIFLTESFQDVIEYTELERVLGARDDRSGVLPLRLVKMLLNIADVRNNHTLLDPFCGSGMLVSVAAQRRVKTIIASDISARAVQDARKNFAAIKKASFRPSPDVALGRVEKSHMTHSPHMMRSLDYARDDGNVFWQVEQQDARELSQHLQPSSIDRIVTEPDLGPPSRAANQREREELSKLYVDSFREFKEVLKPDGMILFIFPVFETEQDFAGAQKRISQMGFHKLDLMRNVQQFFTDITEPVYSRPQQRVKRLLTMWTLSA